MLSTMSLTKQDLVDIRGIVIDAIDTLVTPRFDRLEERMDKLELRMQALEERMDVLEKRMGTLEVNQEEMNLRLTRIEFGMGDIRGRLEAVENDIKALYRLVKKQAHPTIGSKTYRALPDTKKILVLNTAITALARELDVHLPS